MAFTYFFRDKQTLDLIVSHALPMLKGHRHIDVWDAGCAHGPEPYSLAIRVDEAQKGLTLSIAMPSLGTFDRVMPSLQATAGIESENVCLKLDSENGLRLEFSLEACQRDGKGTPSRLLKDRLKAILGEFREIETFMVQALKLLNLCESSSEEASSVPWGWACAQ